MEKYKIKRNGWLALIFIQIIIAILMYTIFFIQFISNKDARIDIVGSTIVFVIFIFIYIIIYNLSFLSFKLITYDDGKKELLISRTFQNIKINISSITNIFTEYFGLKLVIIYENVKMVKIYFRIENYADLLKKIKSKNKHIKFYKG
jgi:hypothetical protein